MRPHSRYSVDRNHPRARGVCDRCYCQFNHDQLVWQYQWAGPRLQNLQILVCPRCLDVPQEQLRTIILPADPTPILNPRPEFPIHDDNPVSSLGTAFGTLSSFGGAIAAFDSNRNKPFNFCAARGHSLAGLSNTAGKNWGAGNTYTASSYSLYAPNNAAFLGIGTAYKFQGSPDGVVWTDLDTGAAAGTIGEIITVSLTPTIGYQYHQIVFSGDGTTKIGLAQLVIAASARSGGGEP